jgi:hypothetical protein
MDWYETELFLQFANDGIARVFAGFHMATCRQPQLRVPMVDQKNLVSINNRKVGDQVLGWRGGL